jgi:hypothetical protein
MYVLARDQLARYRGAVDDDRSGAALVDAVDRAQRGGLDVSGGPRQLRTAPRGWPKDHPRIELLRWGGCVAGRDLGRPAWLGTRRAAGEVGKVWQQAEPLVAWLDQHVGPSQLAPDER